MKTKDLVPVGTIAECFGVSSQTIRNWGNQGLLTIHRTAGGHRRCSLEEVEKLLAKLTKKTTYSSDEKST